MPHKFLTPEQRKQIEDAIREAEQNTSGEIRVHLDRKCGEEVLDRAAHLFAKLNMHQTALRNGVLFYLAFEDHKFAVIGDAGINSKVPEGFWDCANRVMTSNFKEGRFAQGLSEAILMVGEQLKTHFPYQKDDVNELPDEISFGR